MLPFLASHHDLLVDILIGVKKHKILLFFFFKSYPGKALNLFFFCFFLKKRNKEISL